MKTRSTIIAILLIPVISFSQTINTSILNSSGGSAIRGYYQFEWSVGELALVDQMSNGNIIVTNGFLQPYLVNPGSKNDGVAFSADEIKVFPNPASRFVEIDFFTHQKGHVLLELYNAVGQKVYTDQFNCYGVDLIRRIPVTNLRPGSYIMNLSMNGDFGVLVKQGAYKMIKIE